MSSAAAVCNEAVPPERAEPWVVDSDYLFETLVCDVHSCAMQIGVIATMLNASQKPDLIGGLRSCRHMLHDDSKIMTLALRYGSEAGLSPGLAAKLDRLYTGVGGAKRRIAPLLAAKDAAAGQLRLLQTCSQDWRRLAEEASTAVAELSALGKDRLEALYGEDGVTLRLFLSEAARGDDERVSPGGVIHLPNLRQRRQNPRRSHDAPCTILLPTGSAPAQLQDVSLNGLGIVCKAPLAERQVVCVVLEDGRRLEAVVARRQGNNVGLALRKPLGSADPLFRQAKRS